MANSWFRMYSEIRRDPKVKTMPEQFQLRLIWLLTLRCEGPTERLSREELLYGLDCDETTLDALHEAFHVKGFIEQNWSICNWNKRQYVSDSSTERVRKYRASKEQKQDETLPKRRETQNVTPQNRTEQKKIVVLKPAIALPEWLPVNVWMDYEEMRKKKRAGMTDSIRFRIVQRLEEFRARGHDPVAILENSIRKSWTDVFEPGGSDGGNQAKTSGSSQGNSDTARVKTGSSYYDDLLEPSSA